MLQLYSSDKMDAGCVCVCLALYSFITYSLPQASPLWQRICDRKWYHHHRNPSYCSFITTPTSLHLTFPPIPTPCPVSNCWQQRSLLQIYDLSHQHCYLNGIMWCLRWVSFPQCNSLKTHSTTPSFLLLSSISWHGCTRKHVHVHLFKTSGFPILGCQW